MVDLVQHRLVAADVAGVSSTLVALPTPVPTSRLVISTQMRARRRQRITAVLPLDKPAFCRVSDDHGCGAQLPCGHPPTFRPIGVA
jgi:hypothetical protein